MIACVLIAHFPTAVERRDDPMLGERPLVLREQAKVFACSAEAEGAGVKVGMALRQAEALCPQAQWLAARPRRYAEAFQRLVEILADFASTIEASDWQPHAQSYVDLGQARESDYIETLQGIGQAIREQLGLTAAIGLARGKFPTRIAAALADPNMALCLGDGEEARFLAPLAVEWLPAEAEAIRWLKLLGVRTLGQLAAWPVGAAQTQLGAQGRFLQRLAQGRDDRPLIPYVPTCHESLARQFEPPLAEWGALQAVLLQMAVTLSARLRPQGWAAREMRLSVSLEDGAELAERLVFRQPVAGAEAIAQGGEALLSEMRLSSRVAELEIALTGLLPVGGQQLDLFAHGQGQEHQLREALRDLTARYGRGSFYHVNLVDPGARLPERRFQLQEML